MNAETGQMLDCKSNMYAKGVNSQKGSNKFNKIYWRRQRKRES